MIWMSAIEGAVSLSQLVVLSQAAPDAPAFALSQEGRRSQVDDRRGRPDSL